MREALVIHRPARDLEVAEADVDPLAAGRNHRGDFARSADQLGSGALPVPRIQIEEHIGVAEDVLYHAEIQRMAAGEIEPGVHVPYRRAERLGELDQRLETRRLAADELGDDHR